MTTDSYSSAASWDVPDYLSVVTIELYGARGEDGAASTDPDGNALGLTGGDGGSVTADVDVSGIDTLYFRFPDGGNASSATAGNDSSATGGNGGDGALVLADGTTDADVLASAGGGGGGGAAAAYTSRESDDADAGSGGSDDADGQGASVFIGGSPSVSGGTANSQSGRTGADNVTASEAQAYPEGAASSGGGGGGLTGGGAGGAQVNIPGSNDVGAVAGGGGGGETYSGATELFNVTETQGGSTQGFSEIKVTYDTTPATPSVSLSYVDDDQLDLDIAADLQNGGQPDNYEVQMSRDGSAWNSPAGGPSAPSSAGTYSYGPASDTAYERQVGIDSEFGFRVRAVNSDGTSDWAQTGSVYTTPVPPHNPSVSRPDGETIEWSFEQVSDTATYVTLHYREDTGNGYGAWEPFDGVWDGSGGTSGDDYKDPLPKQTITFSLSVGETPQYGDTPLQEDARYQFRLNSRTFSPNQSGYSQNSDWVYADYGNAGNVYFSDGFESGDLSAWGSTTLNDADSGVKSGSDSALGIGGADQGSYYLRLDANDRVKVFDEFDATPNDDVASVIIKAVIAVSSRNNDSEPAKLQWFDSDSGFQDIRTFSHEYNRGGWVEVSAVVPSTYLPDGDLRFAGGGSDGGDHFAIDRVVVSDVLHEYTTPAAPSSLSASGTNNRFEIQADWTNNAADFGPNSFMEIRTRVSESGDPRDKFGIPYPQSNATYNVNDGFDESVPERDGEQYDVRVDALVRQYRRGYINSYWRATSPTVQATTLLPAPTDLSSEPNE